MAIITCKNVAIGYDKKVLVSDLHFSIEKGDYLCIVGENGAGKTTLVRTLLHLIPLIHGEISCGDGLAPNEIGYLPQQTDIQKDFPASVLEIVLSGFLSKMGFRPYYRKEEKEQAKKNLEALGIAGLAKKSFRELSGGQQQRVLLARALCSTDKVLFLDEPITGLDPRTTIDLYQTIKKLNEKGTTIIMVSHDINTSLNYASHILHIGKEIYFGKKESYINSDIAKSFFIRKEDSTNV